VRLSSSFIAEIVCFAAGQFRSVLGYNFSKDEAGEKINQNKEEGVRITSFSAF
jgi:hypothetical protein